MTARPRPVFSRALHLPWRRKPYGQAIRLTHMSKASLADDDPREGGEAQDTTSRIYTIIRDYGGRSIVLHCRGSFVSKIYMVFK